MSGTPEREFARITTDLELVLDLIRSDTHLTVLVSHGRVALGLWGG